MGPSSIVIVYILAISIIISRNLGAVRVNIQELSTCHIPYTVRNHTVEPHPTKLRAEYSPQLAEARIVNGVPAYHGQFKDIVRITYHGDFICGGTILWDYLVITAANCADRFHSGGLEVTAGEHTVGVYEGTEQTLKVSRVIIHPGYTKGPPIINDIALLVTYGDFRWGKYVQDNKVRDADPLYFGQRLTIAGWRQVGYNLSPSKVLMHANMTYIVIDRNGVLHATGYGKSICFGDSGGPLYNADGFQVGISSYVGYPYCEDTAGFTSTKYHYSWILEHWRAVENCREKNYCRSWAAYGYCSSDPDFMRKYCNCGLCQ